MPSCNNALTLSLFYVVLFKEWIVFLLTEDTPLYHLCKFKSRPAHYTLTKKKDFWLKTMPVICTSVSSNMWDTPRGEVIRNFRDVWNISFLSSKYPVHIWPWIMKKLEGKLPKPTSEKSPDRACNGFTSIQHDKPNKSPCWINETKNKEVWEVQNKDITKKKMQKFSDASCI